MLFWQLGGKNVLFHSRVCPSGNSSEKVSLFTAACALLATWGKKNYFLQPRVPLWQLGAKNVLFLSHVWSSGNSGKKNVLFLSHVCSSGNLVGKMSFFTAACAPLATRVKKCPFSQLRAPLGQIGAKKCTAACALLATRGKNVLFKT